MASKKNLIVIFFTILFFAFPVFVHAISASFAAQHALKKIYNKRSDLQKCFRSKDWVAIPSKKTGSLKDLEDWARKFGYKEYPKELVEYAPLPVVEKNISTIPTQSESTFFIPTLESDARFDFTKITANKALIIDDTSRQVLLSRNARVSHPLASITKLMTALVVLDYRIPETRQIALVNEDEVGGARIHFNTGTKISVNDLFYSMLVGSANNAANALARSSMVSKEDFVGTMNEKAKELGLTGTIFVDPAGIEVGNTSTAEDIATLAFAAFQNQKIKKMVTTPEYHFTAAKKTSAFKSTNALLVDEKNGLSVLGGKTGYLYESKWNLAVRMMDSRHKPLMLVVLGSQDKNSLFRDTKILAEWTWKHYNWVTDTKNVVSSNK